MHVSNIKTAETVLPNLPETSITYVQEKTIVVPTTEMLASKGTTATTRTVVETPIRERAAAVK